MRVILIIAASLLCFSGVALGDPPLGDPSGQQQTSEPATDTEETSIFQTVVDFLLHIVGGDNPDQVIVTSDLGWDEPMTQDPQDAD